MYNVLDPVFRTVSGYVTLSPNLERAVNGVAVIAHSEKLPMTKSESVAVGLWELWVTARKVEKQLSKPSAVRSTPSSKNSPRAGLLSPLLLVYGQGTEIDEPLTVRYVVPATGVTASSRPVASFPVQR